MVQEVRKVRGLMELTAASILLQSPTPHSFIHTALNAVMAKASHSKEIPIVPEELQKPKLSSLTDIQILTLKTGDRVVT